MVTYLEWLRMPEVSDATDDTLRDQGKLADYSEMQVLEVWVVSPEARTVEVLQLEDGFLRRSRILADGLLQPKLFPHVQVDIAQIWPD